MREQRTESRATNADERDCGKVVCVYICIYTNTHIYIYRSISINLYIYISRVNPSSGQSGTANGYAPRVNPIKRSLRRCSF